MKKNNPKLFFFITGFLMGIADPIPGVSAGTIAFLSGIYERLLKSLSVINIEFLKNCLKFRIRWLIKKIDWQFLLPLASGVILAIIATANLIYYLLQNYPIFLWSFFLGLVVFSSFFLLKSTQWKTSSIIFLFFGFAIGFLISGIPVLISIENHLFLIFCGFIAITSLLLPGISGAFILVILGQYESIISALKNPFISSNFLILFFFYIGAMVGLLGSSHLLHWLIKKYHRLTLFFLTGLTLGSLRKIWPWKEEIIENGENIFLNQLPELNKTTILACLMIFFGTLFAIFINKLPSFFRKNA